MALNYPRLKCTAHLTFRWHRGNNVTAYLGFTISVFAILFVFVFFFTCSGQTINNPVLNSSQKNLAPILRSRKDKKAWLVWAGPKRRTSIQVAAAHDSTHLRLRLHTHLNMIGTIWAQNVTSLIWQPYDPVHSSRRERVKNMRIDECWAIASQKSIGTLCPGGQSFQSLLLRTAERSYLTDFLIYYR